MAGFIYDSSKIKAFADLQALCNYAGESEEWGDGLWKEMMQNEDLYREFLYYVKYDALNDNMECCGYTLSDIYAWQMGKYGQARDFGKNTFDCRRVAMVLHAFEMMAKMKKDPDTYRKRFGEGGDMEQI